MDGLSINVAEAIKQQYPTLRSLMDAYHDPATTVRTSSQGSWLAGVGGAEIHGETCETVCFYHVVWTSARF
jgi:hypothetical protein